MFFALCLAVAIVLVIGAYTGGAMIALRLGWAAAILAPAWLSRGFGSLTIDLRLVTFLLVIVVAVLSDRLVKRLTLLDGLILLLIGVGIVSMRLADIVGPSEIVAVVAIWLVPYALGRIVVGSISDMDRLLPYAVAVALFLSAWSIVESVTHVNPINLLAGRDGSRIAEQNVRMGLRRAEGPLGHPIYFGMTIAMLFPWTIEAARRASKRLAQPMLLVTPFVCAIGIFCTVSRGPLLVMFATAGTALFFWNPALRIPLAAGGLFVALLVALAWPLVVDELEGFSGETSNEVVSIDGVEYPYSGTKHRTLLYLVYREALEDAGWLGHGKWGFKTEHHLYIDPDLRRTFRSIDNHYVLMTLNWGIIGCCTFLLIGIAGVASAFRLAWTSDEQYQVLLGGLGGSLAAVLLMLLTVWFSSGFGFVWLSSLGMIASCRSVMMRRLPLPMRSSWSTNNQVLRSSSDPSVIRLAAISLPRVSKTHEPAFL